MKSSNCNQNPLKKVAVVTGAARGLGRHIAHYLAAQGMRIAVVDLNLQSFQEFEAESAQMSARSTDEEIRERGGDSHGYEVDLTDAKAVQSIFAQIYSDFGRIDALVCNAGGGSGGLHDNLASSLAPESLASALQRNLFTTVNSCVAAVPYMKKCSGGAIVTLSSINGVSPTQDGAYSHYGVSKAAIAMYTKYLAKELGPESITVNAVAPGTIPTGRLKSVWDSDPALASNELGMIALRRLPELDEIAGAIGFFLSPNSGYTTGQVLVVDGGRTL